MRKLLPLVVAAVLALALASLAAAGRSTEKAQAGEKKTAIFARVDDSGPANFYLTSCTTNPRSVMGRIPAGTKLSIEAVEQCKMGMTVLPFYRVKWHGTLVWISSGTTECTSDLRRRNWCVRVPGY